VVISEKSSEHVAPEDMEHVMVQTVNNVLEIHDRLKTVETQVALIPEIKVMIGSISQAQVLMADSAKSMADTFKRAEERQQGFEARQEAMQNKYEVLASLALGKDQIPLKSHYLSLFAALAPVFVISAITILGILYITKQDVSATLNSLQIKQPSIIAPTNGK